MPQIIAHPLNALLMIAAPIGLGLFLRRKFALPWSLWWIGAATFVLSQVGHIPFNAWLTLLFKQGILPAPPPDWNPLFNAVVLGLSAGLWEELFRYGAYRWWAKDARSWQKGVWLGAGHGGIEAILLGALVLVNFFYLLAMRNTDLSGLVPSNQLDLAQSQVQAYWSAPWLLIFLGALERLLALPIQIGFSVLVLQVFVRRRAFWLVFAIAWHALVDAAAVFAVQRTNPTTAEILVAVASLLSLLLVRLLRQPEPAPEVEPPPPPPRLSGGVQAAVNDTIETSEQLDRTRYQ